MILKKPWLLGGWKPWQSDSHVGELLTFSVTCPGRRPADPPFGAVEGGRTGGATGHGPAFHWRCEELLRPSQHKCPKRLVPLRQHVQQHTIFRTWRIWKSWELGSGSPSTGLQLHGEVHQACWTGALSTGVTESKSQSHQVLKISRCKEVSWKFNEYLISVTLK